MKSTKYLIRFDDKIFVLGDGIHTLAYFRKDLKEQKGSERFSQKRKTSKL